MMSCGDSGAECKVGKRAREVGRNVVVASGRHEASHATDLGQHHATKSCELRTFPSSTTTLARSITLLSRNVIWQSQMVRHGILMDPWGNQDSPSKSCAKHGPQAVGSGVTILVLMAILCVWDLGACSVHVGFSFFRCMITELILLVEKGSILFR